MMKKVLVLLLHLLLLTHPDFIHSESRDPFPSAYKLFSQGNFSKAQDLFLESLDHESVLEDYNLYFLGMIYFHQGALDSARNHFSQLKKKFSKSVWVDQADLHLAKIDLKEGNREQALERLTALGSSSVRNPITNEALFLIGQTYRERGELDQAASYFQKLRYADPLSPWASSAKKEVQSLREQHPQLLGLREPGDMLKEGRLLLLERDYNEAERVFQRSLSKFSEKNLRLRSLLGLAKVYRKSRKRQKESGVLTEIVKQYPGSSQAPKSLSRFAEIFWNQGKDLKALAEFKRLKERYPKSRFIDHADIASARIYESLQRLDEAMQSYQDFPKKHPRSALREQAAWRLAWMHYLQANYSQAHDAFEHIAAGIGSRNYKTGGLFWQARTAERLGQLERAKQIYRQILDAQVDSYYMEPASNALKRMGETVKTRKPTKGLFSSDGSSPRSPNISFHLSRAKKLAEFSLHHLAVVELDQIKKQMDGDPALRVILIQEYVRNQGFDRSVKLANQIYAPPGDLKRYSYPLAYWDIVQKKAVKRGLDPYLVLALVRQESLFNPQALSPASAFGLMQLLATTAGREAKRMGLPPPETEKLYDPDFNIMLGTQHLKGLLQIYSNNLVKAIAAYNAGKTAVDRWERELSALDQEEFIERITYRETRLYVKLVLRNYWIYKSLYNNSDEKTVQK